MRSWRSAEGISGGAARSTTCSARRSKFSSIQKAHTHRLGFAHRICNKILHRSDSYRESVATQSFEARALPLRGCTPSRWILSHSTRSIVASGAHWAGPVWLERAESEGHSSSWNACLHVTQLCVPQYLQVAFPAIMNAGSINLPHSTLLQYVLSFAMRSISHSCNSSIRNAGGGQRRRQSVPEHGRIDAARQCWQGSNSCMT